MGKLDSYNGTLRRNENGDYVVGDGIVLKAYSGALNDGAPTAAELTTLIGATPAVKGAGWMGIVLDTAGTETRYHVTSDGTSWLYSAFTVAA